MLTILAISSFSVNFAFADNVSFDTTFVFPPQNTPDSNYQTSRGSGVAMVGDYLGALRFYDDALSQDPNHVIATSNKGVAYFELDRLDDSLIWIEKTLTLDPNYPQALNNMGWFLAQDDKKEEALEFFEKALKINPNYQMAEKNKIAILIELGQYSPKINSNSIEPSSFSFYKNTDIGFSIEYPSNWIVTDDASGIVYFDSPYENDSDPLTGSFNVSFTYLLEPMSMQEVVDQIEMEYEMIGYDLLESSPTNLSNTPAQKVTAIMKISGQKLQLIQILTIKDDLLYFLTYGSPPEFMPEHMPIFQKMVDSFQFLDSSEVTGKEIQGLVKEANQLYFEYEYAKALEKTNTILILDPNNYGALNLKSLILLDLEKYSEAEQTADKIIELTGYDANSLFVKGLALYGQGKTEESLEYIDEYLSLGEEDPLPLSVKAIILAEKGQLEKSKEILDNTLKRNPDFPYALYAQGYYFYIVKNYDQSIVYLDKALQLDPLNSEFLNNKGLVLMDQEKYYEAELVFDKILKNYPAHSYALNNKGVILLERGENSKALEYFNKASEIEPDNLLFLRNKIATLSSSGITDLAQIAYDQLLKLDPDYDEPLDSITHASHSKIIENEKEVKSTQIPDWVRGNAEWWAQDAIGDSDFVSGIQYLIKEEIMIIPETAKSTGSGETKEIPSWIKNNAEWWAQGLISDDDFVKGIQYLIENGIMDV